MTSLLSSLGQPPRFPTCSHARTGSARGRSYHSLLAAPPMVHGDGRLPFLPSTHPPRNSCRKSLKLDLLPSGGLLVKKGGGEGLAPQPRSPSTSCSGCGGRSKPCDSLFQTLPFFLLQQARPPEPPARCWPPWPSPPGLCSPRWTSSTCSPSTSMAPPRSVSSPTSARYGLGGRVRGVQPSMGVGWEGGLPGASS